MADGIGDAMRQRILDLHREGHGRNAIARELGIAPATVSKHVQDDGGTFDRTASEEATRSRKADLLERRSRLELAYLEDAERLRALVFAPYTYRELGKFSEPDGEGSRSWSAFVEYDQDAPIPADQLKLMQASTIAAAASQKIADAATDQSAGAAKSMLVHMMTGLQQAFREVQAADLDQPGEPA